MCYRTGCDEDRREGERDYDRYRHESYSRSRYDRQVAKELTRAKGGRHG
jgi:hypothetical protein